MKTPSLILTHAYIYLTLNKLKFDDSMKKVGEETVKQKNKSSNWMIVLEESMPKII